MRIILAAVLCFIIGGDLISQTNQSVPGACISGGIKGNAPLNGSGSLGMTYNKSDCGLNFVYANQIVETRYNQYTTFGNLGTGLPTTLTISGIPQCATIDKAYVYYWVSYVAATPPASSVAITNPNPTTSTIASVMIGKDQSKCWGETGTANYRADVTAAISGNGNYGINITGITGTSSNFPNWYDQIDGVCLIIIYKDHGASYQGSMVLWDGNMTGVGNNYTQTMTGINACAAGTNAKAFNLISDMQDNVNSNAHPSTLNGVTANYPNKFWCWDFSNTTVTSGQSTANYGTDGLGGDCFDWGLMGLYYQTTTCTTCVPSAISLTVAPTNSSCGAPNGSATATVAGSSPPFTYSWSTGASTSAISNLAAGTYTVTASNSAGCSTVQTFTISTSMGPAVTFTATPVSCGGGSNGSATVSASGGTPPFTYSWITTPVQTGPTANNLAAGTYSVTVSDASGCSATYTTSVSQPTVLTTTTSVISNASCYGSSDGSASTNPAGGTAPYTYGWTPGAQNTQTASGLAAGSYNVIVTDSKGCTTPSTATITQPTQIALVPSTTMASCGVANGTASVAPSGGTGPYTYLWLTTPVQNTQTINNLAGGTYNVIVTDSKGCTSQSSLSVPSSGPPNAEFANTPDTVNLLDATIFFTDLSLNATTWYWDFGDPNNPGSSTQQNPMHVYSDTGIYCITLIVTDPGGICRDTAVHCIKVEAPFTFYIPNAFTPNNDGWNEMFHGDGTYIKSFSLLIFDRWGNKVFESNDIHKAWDGAVQGGHSKQLVQEDVFVWKVSIMDFNNKKHNYIGHVSMIK
jgi:gliding motility-associated-like protein